jgi:regulator of RNase E activity RraA
MTTTDRSSSLRKHDSTSLTELHTLTVPTLANAVELFHVVPPNEGFTRAPLTCHFPALGICVGYAITVRAITDRAAKSIDEPAYWRWIDEQPGPKVVVVEDDSDPPGGAMWGEWNANVHLALGCVGTVTQGAVRDLDALERLGFHAFATSVSVAHGYGVFVDYGDAVQVAGLAIESGDLLVADRHGALRVPPEIPLSELCDVAREIDRLEAEIFACAQSPDFTVERLAELQADVMARWPKPR